MQLPSFLQYLQYEKRYSEHTVNSYRTDLAQFQAFLSERYELDDFLSVESIHIRAWLVELLQEGLAASSIHRKASSLKSFYKFLRQKAVINFNPFEGVSLPKKGEHLPSFVEEQRMEQLFERKHFPEGFEGSRDFLLIDLLYSTGMRRAELIGLTWSAVDFSGHRLRIYGKGNKVRILPLLPHLEEALRAYQEEVEELFPNRSHDSVLVSDKGKTLYPKLVYNKVKKYLSLVTTSSKKGPHVLRHSFATHLSNKGAGLNAIKDLLGHASLASTQIYTHSSIEQLKKAYQQAHPKAKEKD